MSSLGNIATKSNSWRGVSLGALQISYPAILFIALDFFILLVAYPITKTKLLLLMGSLMLIFIVVSLVLTIILPLGLTVARKIRGTAMVDVSSIMSLTIINKGLDKIGITVYDYIPPLDKDNQLQELSVEYLGKGKSITLEYSIVPKVRGEFELDKVYLRGGDPFGLFQRYIPVRTSGTLTVLPQPLNINYKLPTSVSLIPFEEQSTVNLAGNSSEFFGVRDYQNGDPWKAIHWLASAKRGQLITRIFERNVAGSLSLILINNSQNDKYNPQVEHPLEYQIKLAANLALTAVEQQYILQLAIVSPDKTVITKGTGYTTLQEWLLLLARVQQGKPFNISQKVAETIAQLLPTIRSDQASLLIIITSGLTRNEIADLSRLAVMMGNTLIANIDRSSFATATNFRSSQLLNQKDEASSTFKPQVRVFNIKSGDNIVKSASQLLQVARGGW